MPRKSLRDIAGHLTQAYRTYDGSAKTLTNPDVRNLEFLYTAISKYLEENKASEDLKALHTDLGKLTKKLSECADGINKRTINNKTLDDMQEELGQLSGQVVIQLGNLEGGEKELTKDYLTHLNKMDCTDAGPILHASGEQKSASKWIEEFKAGLKPNEVQTPEAQEKIAMIFAARQLANAKFGKRANIDNTKLSIAEVKNQALKLMASPEFKEYAKNVLPTVDSKTLTHGHGGRLEKTFEQYLVANPTEEPREFDLHGRYQEAVKPALAAKADWVDVDYKMAGVVEDIKDPELVPEQGYKDYTDYIRQNAGKPFVGSKISQAARMAAANDLSRNKPEDPYDKNTLQKKALKFMKDKNFKIMVSDPENVDKLLNGDFASFADELNAKKVSCENMIDDNGKLVFNGYPTLSLNRLEERAEELEALEEDNEDLKAVNKDLKAVIESVDKIMPGEDENAKITAKDVMNAVGTIVDYQNKHVLDSEGDKANDLNDTMRLLHELTKGRYINHIVDDQMKMINEMRGVKPGDPSYMSRELIEAEGIQEEKQGRIDLEIDIPEEPKEVERPNELDKAVNYGQKAPVV